MKAVDGLAVFQPAQQPRVLIILLEACSPAVRPGQPGSGQQLPGRAGGRSGNLPGADSSVRLSRLRRKPAPPGAVPAKASADRAVRRSGLISRSRKVQAGCFCRKCTAAISTRSGRGSTSPSHSASAHRPLSGLLTLGKMDKIPAPANAAWMGAWICASASGRQRREWSAAMAGQSRRHAGTGRAAVRRVPAGLAAWPAGYPAGQFQPVL